ncbi:hypothetical protein AVEN_185733-1 [Araneus ventricosus]|uniref:Uncharacterized protein n=1 Tax=Araneus ventricosus TaxID=182803 RepID=A0A4Y2I1J4_ARAVE|nr:hypothetical protein AVEN_185733-1 [Araneus ventricosus]
MITVLRWEIVLSSTGAFSPEHPHNSGENFILSNTGVCSPDTGSCTSKILSSDDNCAQVRTVCFQVPECTRQPQEAAPQRFTGQVWCSFTLCTLSKYCARIWQNAKTVSGSS